ncbi:MAG: hypothetical protein ACRCSU_01400 [Paracoccaceae bacterium]
MLLRPALILALVLPQTAIAECAIPAFVRADAPGAPVILSAPEDGSEQIGAVPMVNDDERGMMGGEATITDIRNGYAHLSKITAWDNRDVTAPDGWVSAADLAFVVQTAKGFAAADATAQMLWQGDDWIYPDMFTTLEACEGAWVALRMADPKISDPIWVRGVCGGQETTCDGVQGD